MKNSAFQMLDSSSGTTLLWCVVLGIELCLIASTSQAIYCTTNDAVKTPCRCREVKQVKWSSDGEDPAPGPSNMTLSLLRYRTNEQEDCIRVLVAWTQKASHFQSNYVLGYDIEATVGHLTSPKYFECATKDIVATSGMVSFIFNDTAISSWCPIPPDVEITYTINARPIYTNGSNPSWIYRTIETPIKDSYDEPRRGIKSEDTVEAKTPVTTPGSYITDSWHSYAVSAFVIALGIIALALLICFICRKIVQNDSEQRRILVIGNINENESTKTCLRVIDTLKRWSGENVEIETNIQNSSEVGEHGMLQWISEKVTAMDVVIFIVLSHQDYAISGENSEEISQVAIAMKAAQAIMLHRSQSSIKFIAYSSCELSNSCFCQCYNMKLEQKKFLKQALGSLYKPNRSTEKRQWKTLEKSCTTFESETMIKPQNDLNQGTTVSEEYNTSAFSNIGGMTSICSPLESIENNEMV